MKCCQVAGSTERGLHFLFWVNVLKCCQGTGSTARRLHFFSSDYMTPNYLDNSENSVSHPWWALTNKNNVHCTFSFLNKSINLMTTSMENSIKIAKRIKNKTTIWSSNYTSGYIFWKKQNHYSKEISTPLWPFHHYLS